MNPKNIEKINWEYVGIYKRDKRKVFGKMVEIRCCPVCNNKDMLLYKNKGRFKIKCVKCPYERIDKKIEENVQENKL